MSIGRRIQQLRLQTRITQRGLGEATGLAVAYLSRVENSRLTPSVPTLTKIASALGVPVTALFDATPLEAKDLCPVSLSGQCILDQLYLSPGKKPKKGVEAYSREQLEVLRLCNFLLHQADKDLLRTLKLLMKGMLALKQASKSRSSPAKSISRRQPT